MLVAGGRILLKPAIHGMDNYKPQTAFAIYSLQEAQLSQRVRAMPRVVEYFR